MAWLVLCKNRIGDVGLRALSRSVSLGQLRRLDLRHNRITERGLTALAQSPLGERLRSLLVCGNDIPPQRLREIRPLFPRLVEADF